ncbi:MAG TPA: O-antigen ligase family protein [Candidatus Acidoferrum sp.]|nr:O-antigen ligase family protein [Candidatus Acidoferrum sp.]
MQKQVAPGIATSLESAAAAVCGETAVGIFWLVGAFADWVGGSSAWILFFLALKPLIDLTWRWNFFRFSEQSVNTQALVGLAVLGLNGVATLRNAAWRRLPRRVLVMLAFASLSVIFSPSSWGFNELMRLLAGTTFFYTAGPLLADPRHFDRFAKIFLCAMTAPVILSYFQWAGILPYDYWDWLNGEAVGRASGTYPTPLSMSFFFYYAFPIALAVACGKNQSSRAKSGAFLFLLLASGAVALSNHRMAYVIVALQVLIWLGMTQSRKAVLAFLAVLTLVVVLSFSWLQTLYAPMRQALSGDADVTSGEFLRGRGFQWFLFLNSYASSGPFHWVFGNGASIIAGYDPEATDVDSVEPHNDYIRILHAYGAVGLLLYLSVLALFLKKTFQFLGSREEFPRMLAQIMLLALIAMLIQSMLTEPMRYPTGVWYLFAIGSALFCVETGPVGVMSLPT